MTTTPTTLPAELQGREIAVEQDFNSIGDWQAFQAAELWVEERHYNRGPLMHHGHPVGIVSVFRKDMEFVREWKHLTTQQRASLDGLMTGDFRNGPVRVTIFKPDTLAYRATSGPEFPHTGAVTGDGQQ